MNDQNRLIPGFVPMEPGAFPCRSDIDLRSRHWDFCEFRFRGLLPEIEKLVKYLHENGLQDHTVIEVSEQIREVRLWADGKTPELIEQFPALKATGLAENWQCAEVNTLFSESGCAGITQMLFGGWFDGHQDSGDARWEWKYDMMERVGVRFTWMQTGEEQYVAYRYPFRERWDRDNYTRELDGTIYVPENWADRAFEINDGVLVGYYGIGGDVVIPDAVREISRFLDSFQQNPAITSVVVPGSVERIPQRSFMGCVNLHRVVLEEGVRHVDMRAFENCPALTELILPRSLVSLAANAFLRCHALDVSALELPDGLLGAGQAFRFCKNEPELLLNRDQTILLSAKLREEPFRLILPGTVTKIGDYALHRQGHLTQIDVPPGLRRIGDSAFEHCSALELTEVPDTVEEIGNAAFHECGGITAFRFPAAMKSIPKSIFAGTFSSTPGPDKFVRLREITVSEGTVSIGEEAFCGFVHLRSLRLPASLEQVGSFALAYCENLPELILPDGLRSLGANALRGCKSLQTLRIPDGIAALEDEVLRDCVKLRRIHLPEKLCRIGKKAFRGCSNLETIDLGDTIEQIAEGAFAACESLTAVTLPSSVRTLGKEAFKGCIRLKSLTIPGSVKEIPLGMAQDCGELQSVRIEPGIEKIAGRAFKNCPNLQTVDIPPSVKKLGPKIFDDAANVTIRCVKGSPAEKYALANQIKTKPL